jgi:hypothetical protein
LAILGRFGGRSGGFIVLKDAGDFAEKSLLFLGILTVGILAIRLVGSLADWPVCCLADWPVCCLGSRRQRFLASTEES